VDRQQRTNVPHIFAIGDIVGQPMLAHKATQEGKVAAEAAAGRNSFLDAKVIPSVAYTDPEVAWVGMTENEAKAKGIKYGKGVFPWAASGRSLSLGRDEGVTKLLFDEATNRLLGCGIGCVCRRDVRRHHYRSHRAEEEINAVLAFHAAALNAGGQDERPPGLYIQYHAHYFAALILDPDGHRIEAICHSPETPSPRPQLLQPPFTCFGARFLRLFLTSVHKYLRLCDLCKELALGTKRAKR